MTLRAVFCLDDRHPFTGWHMAAVVGLFFGIVIAVNLVMAVIATGSFPGLVVRNSYVASQHYNELLRQGREQAGSGMVLNFSVEKGIVTARFIGREGGAIGDLAVRALIGRPSSAAEDRRIDLVADQGSYRATDLLPAGNWLVEIAAYRGDALVFRERKHVFVRPE